MTKQAHILVFGAGKSATVLIDFLKKTITQNNWLLMVADSNLATVLAKLDGYPGTTGLQINIEDQEARKSLVKTASIVISMMPPSLHYLIAEDCLEFGINLLTASYLDEKTKALSNQVQAKGLLFLYEMGLDPGIDHMSAMQIIHEIQSKGGVIKSFRSHCGGLVAPENDDNPWHYKISWNPRNVVLAGSAGARYLEHGEEVTIPYHGLFNNEETLDIPGLYPLGFYPNRDSLSYIPIYGLHSAKSFVRTTLRYPEFLKGWSGILHLGLTDNNHIYQIEHLSIAAFFKIHIERLALTNWMDSLEEQSTHEAMAAHFLEQLNWLGLHDQDTHLPMTQGTAADVLQFLLETKLALLPGEKDMIVMQHEFEYQIGTASHSLKSALVCIGEDDQQTAMAKTVGLPLGIAAKLILENQIQLKGLHIPILPQIYEPVLAALKAEGIEFQETKS
ncbi:MAG: saccharopine dehydrogenase [Chitinophagaceae bacterium BSSC1]|nr:MAG: saccharopine dehydrogenase [Chitinophagaceae bacterium BSSC1]